MRTVLCLAAAGLLAGCATPSELEAGPDTAGPGASGGTDSELSVEIDRGDGTPLERYTLRCGDEVSGDHPDAAAACAHLAAAEDAFPAIPVDAVCTEQYGGPQTALVVGVWEGEPIDLALDRTDGCHIAQWDALGPLLPG